MGQKAKLKSIEKAGALAVGESDIRVVMPTAAANAVHSAIGGGGQIQPLVYNAEKEAREGQMNWHQIEDLSNTIGNMIGQTAEQFQETIVMVQSIGHVEDMARFKANVQVTMEDLSRFTDEFILIKARHEGKTGFITEAQERMAYLAIFEDYHALSAYFQGTMHHKLIEFTEYALNAKDKLLEQERQKEEQAAQAPAVETPATEA